MVAGRKIAGAPSLAAPVPCRAALASPSPTTNTGSRAMVRHAQPRSRRVFRALRGAAAPSDRTPFLGRSKRSPDSGRAVGVRVGGPAGEHGIAHLGEWPTVLIEFSRV